MTDDLDDVDTTTTPLADRHAMMWNGVNQFVNRAVVKADVSDFVEGDYVHTTGNETIAGEKTFVDLRASGDIIQINSGEMGAGVGGGSGSAGVQIDRGSEPDAVLQWNEGTQTWLIGVVGDVGSVLTDVHTAQPDYAIVAGTGAAAYTLPFTLIAAPSGKANLQVFVNGIKQVGDILGLKAYTVAGSTVTFTAGNIPAVNDDVEFYGFGTIS